MSPSYISTEPLTAASFNTISEDIIHHRLPKMCDSRANTMQLFFGTHTTQYQAYPSCNLSIFLNYPFSRYATHRIVSIIIPRACYQSVSSFLLHLIQSFPSSFCPLSSLILPTLLLLPPPQDVSNLFRNPAKYADSSLVVLCSPNNINPRYKPTPNSAGVLRRCNVEGFLTGLEEGISDFFVDKLRYILCDDLGIVL